MKDREYRCSECLELQKEEMESPYLCGSCKEVELRIETDNLKHIERLIPNLKIFCNIQAPVSYEVLSFAEKRKLEIENRIKELK